MMATQTKKRKKKSGGSSERRNIWLLILTTILILASVYVFTPPSQRINQGLDIQGGLSVVLTATSNDGNPVTKEEMEASRAIIESRVNSLGASEAAVQLQGDNQILVQIPGATDTKAALETIGKTGKLEFARLDSFTDEAVRKRIDTGDYGKTAMVTDEFGNQFPSKKKSSLKVQPGTYKALITGENITNVSVDRASETGTDYAVNVRLNGEGTAAFAKATRELAPTKGKIVIVLDGEVQSAPAVQSVIVGGRVSITGGYTLAGGKGLRSVL